MFLKNYYFRFSWLGTILAIAGIVLFTSLGIWQTQRAFEKQQLQDEIDGLDEVPAFTLNENTDNLEAMKRRKVTATGIYDKDNEILIDNIVQDGQAGYYVMTPLLFENTHTGPAIIMVNRGWVPVGRDRNVLPVLDAPVERLTLHGVISPPRSKPPIILGELDNRQKVWPYFDVDKYAQRINSDVLPVIILLDKQEPGGYQRNWPKYEAKVAMHIGYAIQWYVFAIIVLVTYFGLNIKKRENNDITTDS